MNRRDFIVKTSLSTSSIAILNCSDAYAEQNTMKPNLIYVLSDDQNWDGLSVRMDPIEEMLYSRYVETPNIAKLAGAKQTMSETIEGGNICRPFKGSTGGVKRRFQRLAFYFPHYQGQTPNSVLHYGDYIIINTGIP